MNTFVFLKIGGHAVNLANVAYVYEREYDTRHCLTIVFVNDHYVNFYSNSPGYRELRAWMDEQPILVLENEEVEYNTLMRDVGLLEVQE